MYPVIVKKIKLTNFIDNVSEAVSGIFLPPTKLRPQKKITMFTNRKRVYSLSQIAKSPMLVKNRLVKIFFFWSDMSSWA